MDEIQTKICSTCCQEKPLDCYSNSKNEPLGKSYSCKECCKIKQKKYRETEKYKTCIKKWNNSEKGITSKKEAQSKFARSSQGKEIRKKWLVENKWYPLLKRARQRAKDMGQEFCIDKNDIVIDEKCPVLGIVFVLDSDKLIDASPTLDRIDNTKGYVKGNVCVISNRANVIKNSGSITEHKRIVDYMNRKICLGETYDNTDDKKKDMISRAIQRSKKKTNIEVSISAQDIQIPKICPVLGISLSLTNTRLSDNSPSLDRIDNTKGYTPDNICVISNRANTIKGTGTKEEHQRVIDYMINKQVGENHEQHP